jgi:hypothetical protein
MSTLSIFKGIVGKSIDEVTATEAARVEEGLAVRLPSGVDPQDALSQASSFGAPAVAAGVIGAGGYLKNEIGARVIDKGIGLATSAASKVASMVRGPQGGGSPFNKVINKELRMRQQEQPQTEASMVPNGARPSALDPSGEAHGVGKRTEAANPAPPPAMKVSPSSVLKGIAKSAAASTKSLQAATAQTTATVAGALQPKAAPAAPAGPAKREQTDEGLRLIKTHTNGPRSAKVYKDTEYKEYRVKHYTDGKHHEPSDYFTDDADDAHATAQHWTSASTRATPLPNRTSTGTKGPGGTNFRDSKAWQASQASRKAVKKDEATDEGLKLIHTDSKDNRSAKVYRDHDYNEYRVKHFTDGKHHKKADYHTDDKLDAMSTADHWLHGTANESKDDECAGCGEKYPCSDSKRKDISGRERAKHFVDPEVTASRKAAAKKLTDYMKSPKKDANEEGEPRTMGSLFMQAVRDLPKTAAITKNMQRNKDDLDKHLVNQAARGVNRVATQRVEPISIAFSPRGSWQKSERLEDPFAEAERIVQELMTDDVDEISRRDFANKGSALRAAHKHNPRNQPCPTCKEPNKLTPKDVKMSYQCDDCARREEGPY